MSVANRLCPGLCLALAALVAAASGAARADVVSVLAQMDNTIFEEDGSLSNGAGQYIFAGDTAFGFARRALIKFDVAAAVPAGSTVTSAVLSLRLSRTGSLDQPVSLHRLTATWGEAGSNAVGQEGTGTAAQVGDATWSHRFFSSQNWAALGGDFVATASASTVIGGPCLPENGQNAACIKYNWSTAGMVLDVQGWLDQPSTNFGWILRGNEASSGSAKRFDSRQSPTTANRPLLRVFYDPPVAAGPGSVPDGGAIAGVPLELSKSPGQLHLSWSPSCSVSAVDYEVYEGTIGGYYDHAQVTCSTLGATGWTMPMPLGSLYYLVVPSDGADEGGYGVDSDGGARPASVAPCLATGAGDCS